MVLVQFPKIYSHIIALHPWSNLKLCLFAKTCYFSWPFPMENEHNAHNLCCINLWYE